MQSFFKILIPVRNNGSKKFKWFMITAESNEEYRWKKDFPSRPPSNWKRGAKSNFPNNMNFITVRPEYSILEKNNSDWKEWSRKILMALDHRDKRRISWKKWIFRIDDTHEILLRQLEALGISLKNYSKII